MTCECQSWEAAITASLLLLGGWFMHTKEGVRMFHSLQALTPDETRNS
jgi:hypothetical protein